MLTVKGLDELRTYVGKEIGVSDWFEINQERINQFAEATGDHQWIHVNVEMAKQFSPFKTTIAHGFMTLSLMPMLMEKIWKIEGGKMGVNYGTNKVRFTAPVPVDSKIRLKASLAALQDIENGGVQMTVNAVFEREGQEKPVCVAEAISLLYF
ncbi:MAG: MaoC family dehydratase [Microscillaceae bacterium]|jgi:acyl dehydratase|nr:MaoC family dehydratase [Microscillaceae bacterium]